MAEAIRDDEIEVLLMVDGKPFGRTRVSLKAELVRVPFHEGGWRFGQHVLKPTGKKDEYGTPIWA